jgi:hypothetical protein
MIKKRYYVLLLVLSLALSLTTLSIQASSVNVKLQLTNNGSPAANQRVSALSYSKATSKIEKGDFSNSDLNSSAWTICAQNYSSSGGEINLGNGLVLGKGITHSSKETLEIFSQLYQEGNVNFLQFLNGSTLTGVSTGLMSNMTVFHVPGITTKAYTDANGNAEANLPEGLAVIIDDSNNYTLLKTVSINSKTGKISADAQNSTPKFSFNLTGMPTNLGRNFIVEYNQPLNYLLTINKDLLASGETLTLTPNSNLIIDNISFSSTETSLIENPLNPNAIAPEQASLTDSSQLNPAFTSLTPGVPEAIGNALISKAINKYDVSLPASSDEDIIINITAHLASTQTLTRTLTLNGQTQAVTIPLSLLPDPGQSQGINATINSPSGIIHSESPTVTSSGINFVMADASKDKMVKGAQYVLGKVINQETQVYNGTAWEPVSSLDDLNMSDIQVFTGGNQYIIGTSGSQTIAYNTAHFGFDKTVDAALNQSLIQIRGLAQGSYFLYQITPATGFTTNNIKTPFTVSANSIGNASNVSYNLESQIPDYSSGIQEYNILPVTSAKSTAYHPFRWIKLPIFLTVIFICILGLLLAWRF